MNPVSRITAERIARCPFSVANEYAVEFFRAAEQGVELRVPLRDVIRQLRGQVRKPVRLTFAPCSDDQESGRVHDALAVEWTAGTRLFPQFHGTLRLRIATVETTRLTLEGAYRPPFGLLGRIFDRVAGRRIARATICDLLDRLAVAIEDREAAFRAKGTGSGITA